MYEPSWAIMSELCEIAVIIQSMLLLMGCDHRSLQDHFLVGIVGKRLSW